MKTEKYNILLSLKVSGGEKGMHKDLLKRYLSDNITILDDMHVITTTIPMYTYEEEGTKKFEKEVFKTIRPFVSYVFDNLGKFIEIHQDTTFESPLEYVEKRDDGIIYRAYGVGCLSPYILEISKEK